MSTTNTSATTDNNKEFNLHDVLDTVLKGLLEPLEGKCKCFISEEQAGNGIACACPSPSVAFPYNSMNLVCAYLINKYNVRLAASPCGQHMYIAVESVFIDCDKSTGWVNLWRQDSVGGRRIDACMCVPPKPPSEF
jgi:hypothetical protein